MKTLVAKFVITTPMFLGGAHQQTLAIRPPSIKGALRFWWRASAWKSTFIEAKKDAVQALRNLHMHEARIFGSAADDNATGQGIFLLSVDAPASRKSTFKPQLGHRYLLGQGLFEPGRNSRLLRDPLDAEVFTVKVLFKPLGKKADKAQWKKDQRSLIDAILLWGLLGGLGSRARKGFGSVAIQSLEAEGVGVVIPQNADELKELLVELIGDRVAEQPPFSAFSQAMRVDISETGGNALSLLNTIGESLQIYRNSGRKFGKVVERDARNFRGDADSVRTVAQGRNISKHPERAAFGLPHNYHFKNVPRSETDIHIEPAASERNRRSSPLFIHVHQFPNGKCCVVQTFLPAMFLPKDDQIEMKAQRNTQKIAPDIDWSVITDYLDRFAKNSDYRQVIP